MLRTGKRLKKRAEVADAGSQGGRAEKQQLKYNMKFNTCLLEHKVKEEERLQSEVYKKIIKKYR